MRLISVLKQITALSLAFVACFGRSDVTMDQLKSFLADSILNNDTSDSEWATIKQFKTLKVHAMNYLEDQKNAMDRLIEDLIDLQLKVASTVTPSNGSCKWDNHDETEFLPPDCSEAFKKYGHESGVYKIKPPGTNALAFHAYCLKDNASSGDPWIVIQRRYNGIINFNRKWSEYKIGFGSLDDEFWLGLEYIYTITNSASYELRITLRDWDKKIYVANYDNFVVSNEESKYALRSIGVHSGNALDSITQYQSGHKWSTFDNDNDDSQINCAKYYRSGWWYRRCMYCNLNGEYPTAEEIKHGLQDFKGIYWGGLKNTSFRASEMAIRKKKKK